MALQSPDWRWIAVQEAIDKKIPPDDAVLRTAYDVLVNGLEHEVFCYAFEIYGIPEHRDTLVAWFLSGANFDQMEQGTGVDPDTLSTFGKLFMDTSVFRNKMEWRSFAEYYSANCCANSDGKSQVQKAILDGPLALLIFWRHGNEQVLVKDSEVMSQQILIAQEKSLAARNARLTDPESKEAYKWGQLALSAAQRRSTMHDTEEIETDAIVAIRKRKATLTATEAGLDLSEIIH